MPVMLLNVCTLFGKSRVDYLRLSHAELGVLVLRKPLKYVGVCTRSLSTQIMLVTRWFCKHKGNGYYGSKKQGYVFLFFEGMKEVNNTVWIFYYLHAFIISFTEILSEKDNLHTWEWARFITRVLQRKKGKKVKLLVENFANLWRERISKQYIPAVTFCLFLQA